MCMDLNLLTSLGAPYLHATDGHAAVQDASDRRQERGSANDIQVS